jgi:hypothetical protein
VSIGSENQDLIGIALSETTSSPLPITPIKFTNYNIKIHSYLTHNNNHITGNTHLSFTKSNNNNVTPSGDFLHPRILMCPGRATGATSTTTPSSRVQMTLSMGRGIEPQRLLHQSIKSINLAQLRHHKEK